MINYDSIIQTTDMLFINLIAQLWSPPRQKVKVMTGRAVF